MRALSISRLAGAAGRLASNSKRVQLKNGWEVELRERGDAACVELFGDSHGGLFRLVKGETSKYYRVLLRLEKLNLGEESVRIDYRGRSSTHGVLEWAALLSEAPDGGRQFALRERLRSVPSPLDVAGNIDGRLSASYQGPYFVAFQFSTEPGEFVLERLTVEVGGASTTSPGRDQHLTSPAGSHPLFDAAWYLGQLSSPLSGGDSALSHYLRIGAAQGLSPHPLFDPEFYLAQLSEPLRPGDTALQHYLRIGAERGLSPHPLFDPGWYRRAVASSTTGGNGR